MSESDLRTVLEHVGEGFDLGEYEIAAYLAVLEHGELTASGIADRTDVPQPRVYDTVRSLGERGLVEIRESRPMTVVAVDPEEAFAGLRSSLVDLVDDLETLYTTPERETEAVSLVKSRTTILRYFEEVIGRAEYELTLSLTPTLVARFEEELAAARERGVDTELVVTPAADAPESRTYDYDRIASAARARRGVTSPLLAVADGDYSIYATQGAVGSNPDQYAVIFNRSALGFLVLGFFGTVLWTTAETELLSHDGAPSLPRRYASIRRCVKDLRSLDGDLYATVEGRGVESGDERTVRGRVAQAELEETEEVATVHLETDDGETVTVGGRVAATRTSRPTRSRSRAARPPERSAASLHLQRRAPSRQLTAETTAQPLPPRARSQDPAKSGRVGYSSASMFDSVDAGSSGVATSDSSAFAARSTRSAGTPTIVAPDSTSDVTTAPAPTFASSPTSMSPRSVASAPMVTRSPTVGCRFTGRWSAPPSVTPWYMWTSSPTTAVSPMTTPIPWSMTTRSPISAPGWISTPVSPRTTCEMTRASRRSPSSQSACVRR
ncbi:transcriptional regulator, trmB family [Halarchaeum acidiphilum MH1-52-1]|uniref:Transcriptional regulator, trmB family n=1 Tax=Halarchaeum acidiphilum MH1-52-1 TaxID=1261545 RepID=U2YF78_9EURY|nr:transcriptional regulator, trmB family [Halarchaeum acidiphilum MH1-52-1]